MCVADGAGAEEVAFVAGFAAVEKRLRRSGPYVAPAKRSPGQCIEHQFDSGGCKKGIACQYQHDSTLLGKYAEAADGSVAEQS